MSHSKSHTDRMDTHELGKRQHAPKTAKFHNAGAVRSAGGGISVNLDELVDALHNLDNRAGMFETTVRNSSHLDADLPNGHGPVAETMGKVFGHRLGGDGGVQYALHSHLSRLNDLVDNLTTNVKQYQDGEGGVTGLVQGVPGLDGGAQAS